MKQGEAIVRHFKTDGVARDSLEKGCEMEQELAQGIVHSLRDAGIGFISYLPETRLSQILPLLREDPSFMVVPVANESEAVSIAAGASLGGRPAAVYMEGSGVYVSSYNLLVIGKRLGVPMLLIVAHYGSTLDRRNSFLYAYPGIHLIPLLQSLNLQYEVFEDANNLEEKIKGTVRMMHAVKEPVALLFTGVFTV
ncbi:MAG: thiamine pyrophosphate-binding protein [Acidobacteriota bacterium]